jgi:hypothetical protein
MTDKEERARVFSKIAPLILLFASLNAGKAFHAEDLRRHVLAYAPEIAPASSDRILRELRLRRQLNYVVINRRQSLYMFVPVLPRVGDLTQESPNAPIT